MKLIFTLLFLLMTAGSFVGATSLKVQSGHLYQGEESFQDQKTGNVCYLRIDYVEPASFGRHCYKIIAQAAFLTDQDELPNEPITLQSRVTNMHRAEYPKIKSCAVNENGKTSENDIYQEDAEKIYTSFFAGELKRGSTTFSLFLSIDPESKTPSRVRLHQMGWFSEASYDCLNLKQYKH